MKPVKNPQESAVFLEGIIVDIFKENHQFKCKCQVSGYTETAARLPKRDFQKHSITESIGHILKLPFLL